MEKILSYEELVTMVHEKATVETELREAIIALHTRHNHTLNVLLGIKNAYPHIFEECMTNDTMDKICGKE